MLEDNKIPQPISPEEIEKYKREYFKDINPWELVRSEHPLFNPKMAGMVCISCGIQKPIDRFGQKKRPDITHKVAMYRDPECLKCRTALGDPSLRRQVAIDAENKAYKKMKAEERKERKKQLRNKIKAYGKQIDADKRSENDAEREVLRRILARRSLIRFVQRFTPGYEAGWVHHDICARLEQFFEDVQNKKDPRLMLFMPPRHGKSEIASKKFPAWALGHRPDYDIISASYAASLSEGFSHKVRELVSSQEYQRVFPTVSVNKERMNIQGWETNKGGVFTPAGTQGAVTGKGANILIIDDPVKDAEEADSETIREKIWDWYGTTAHSRLAPDSGVLVIQTRWNDDDLSGRLINHMVGGLKEVKEYREFLENADEDERLPAHEIDRLVQEMDNSVEQWEIISYPALAEKDEYITEMSEIVRSDEPVEGADLLRKEGEALHPERFPRERLLKTKRVNQKRYWSALYQQNPVPDEGLEFKKEMFRYIPHQKKWDGLAVGIAFDLAIGKNSHNDYTVGAVGALDFDDNLHILDVVRGRWGDPYEIANLMLDLYSKYSARASHTVLGIEQGMLNLAIRPELVRQTKKRGIYPVLDESLKPVTDKMVRSKPLQGRMQAGTVIFPRDQPWVEVVEHELLRFPGGVHDDIVDSLAWLARMAGNSFHKPSVKSKPKRKSWKDNLKPYTKNNRSKDWKAA